MYMLRKFPATALYLPLTRNLVVVNFLILFLCTQILTSLMLSMWLETTMEVKAKQSENGVKLTLCKTV